MWNSMMIFLESLWFILWSCIFFFFFMILSLWFTIQWEKEKYESYECGFHSFEKSKSTFCIRFFNVAILFLLVDLEIVLFLPLFMKHFQIFMVLPTLKFMSMFLLFLLFLLWLEYKMGGLSWKMEL